MLLEELKEIFKDGQFGGLKLVDSVYSVEKRNLKLRFITTGKLSDEDKKAVTDAAGALIKSKLHSEVKVFCTFENDYTDADTVKVMSIRYFNENFPALLPFVESSIAAVEKDDGSVEVNFTVDSEKFLLFKQMDIINKCGKYFESVTNRKITIKPDVVRAVANKEELREWAKQKQELQIAKAAYRPQRTINVEGVTEYIGRGIAERPRYIADTLEREEKFVTVCGKVQSPCVRVTSSGYTLFKFELADHTSSISVVMFPNEDPAMLKKLQALQEGDEVLLSGSVALNGYSHNMEFKAYRVSKCKINEPDYLSLKTREVPQQYINVKEEDFAPPQQFNLFAERTVPPQLKGKSFVVFDFETTGKEFLKDKIIELGAVKINDGIITKKFSSFVNPERDIPREITELTGITNKDVAKSPVFEEIIPDFYKFAYGSELIAHNIDFDFGFLRFNTKDSGYIFSQKQVDSLSLARRFFALPQNKDNRPPNYQLATLAAHMGVDCQNAHRAIDDAMMTAEIFLKIMTVFEG